MTAGLCDRDGVVGGGSGGGGDEEDDVAGEHRFLIMSL